MKGKPLHKAPTHGDRVGLLDDDQNILRWGTVDVSEDENEQVRLRDGTITDYWQLCLL